MVFQYKEISVLICLTFILFTLKTQASFAEEIDTKTEEQQQNKIPEKIEEDLILTYSKKVYRANGFILKKGVNLTIEPGVKIITEKGKAKPTIIEGTLLCGVKGGLTIEWNAASTIEFSGTKVELYNTILRSSNFNITGGTEGLFYRCIIERYFTRRSIKPIEITIPRRHEISFTKCHFINHSLDLPNNILDTPKSIQFELCTFSPVWDEKINKYQPIKIDCRILIVGNKCDLYSYLSWKSINCSFEPEIETNWFLKDKTMKKQIESTFSKLIGFNLLYASTAFTNFKPELPPPPEKQQKDKK